MRASTSGTATMPSRLLGGRISQMKLYDLALALCLIRCTLPRMLSSPMHMLIDWPCGGKAHCLIRAHRAYFGFKVAKASSAEGLPTAEVISMLAASA